MPHEQVFAEKLQKHLDLHGALPSRALTIHAIIYSLIVFCFVFLYNMFASGFSIESRMINRVMADSGMILIGISFALSGICYYWNFADHLIIYRKHIGLAGFALALSHSVISLFRLPLKEYYLLPENIAPFISAVVAIVIYIVMAVISNRYAVRELGGIVWRRLLRVGYLAYFLTIVHFGLKGYKKWMEWLLADDLTQNILPPFGLIALFFGVLVIILRLALFVQQRTQRKETKVQNDLQLPQSGN